MRKIFVSAMAVGAAAVAGATVSVKVRAESAPALVTLGAGELDAVKGGQLDDSWRSFTNRTEFVGNTTTEVVGNGDNNIATATSTLNITQDNRVSYTPGASPTPMLEP